MRDRSAGAIAYSADIGPSNKQIAYEKLLWEIIAETDAK
jgi:hypothetical protein